MNILHICSAYAHQQLYDEMISNLERCCGVRQFVYIPVRSKEEVGRNRNASLKNTQYQYSHILRRYHRILFRHKISTVLRDLKSILDARNFSVAHAHFLYSDGAVALKLKQEFGLPYITAVRNTDLNYFMRYRPDLLLTCREILAQASAVVFVAPAYREKLLSRLPDNERIAVLQKSQVVPNGIASFWLKNPPDGTIYDKSCLRLLYVGDFSRNKNVPTTMRAADILAKSVDTRLTLIGGGGNGEKNILKMLSSGRFPRTTFAGRIDSRDELLRMYRQHDIYVMPSFRETFGLAYIEAMSQGLPVVPSRGQGVDGYFDKGTVSEAADPHDPADVARAIQTLATRLPEIRDACVLQAGRFEWSRIAEIYSEMYTLAARSA